MAIRFSFQKRVDLSKYAHLTPIEENAILEVKIAKDLEIKRD
ncbi:hypothetical protein [Lactobacillus sp. ESL0246]|nr:hypothetical protein [Lactobacillus sp. ESL0246]